MNKCPQLSIRRRLRSGVSNLHSRYRSWTHLVRSTVCPIVCGISGMRIHRSDGKLIKGAGTTELPAVLRNNRTVIGTSGVAGASNDWHWWTSLSTRGDDEKVVFVVTMVTFFSECVEKLLRQEPASGVGRKSAREDLA